MGAPIVNPPPEAVQGKSPIDWSQVLRECVTAGISLAIVVVALGMLVSTFCRAGKVFTSSQNDDKRRVEESQAYQDVYSHQKDLLLLALGLLGTVTGYYLGRAPAELRAQNAQQAATVATTQLSGANITAANATATAVQATKEASAAKTTLTNVRTKLTAAKPQVSKTLGAEEEAIALSPEQQAITGAIQDIDDFMKRN